MNGGSMWLLLTCVLATLLLLAPTCAAGNLYGVLGVSSTASPKAIRNAYLKLAKKWHPDKNRSPEAPDMMMKINKAYNVLSDERRRKRYDTFGDEEESPFQQHHQSNGRWSGFEFHGQTFTFNFKPPTSNTPPDDINTRQFFDTVVPESDRIPQLIFFYNDWCTSCPKIADKWAELKEDLLDIGIVTGSVHTVISSQSARYCKVHMAPNVGAILERKCYLFNERLKVETIKKFIASLLPDSLFYPLPTGRSLSALDRVRANKPMVIAFSASSNSSLALRLVAFAQREFCSVVFASGNEGKLWRERLGVGRYMSEELLVVFKDTDTPAVTREYSNKDPVTLKEMVEEHKVLFLPRVSSQLMMEKLCPFEPESKACLILLVDHSSQYNDSLTHSYRQLAIHRAGSKKISLGYIDFSKQRKFLSPMLPISVNTNKCPNGDSPRPVLLLKRQSIRRAQYDWFDLYCGFPEDEAGLIDSVSGDLRHNVFLNLVNDEFAPGIIEVLYEKMKEQISNNPEQTMAFLVLFLPAIVLGFLSTVCRKERASSSSPTEESPRTKRTSASEISEESIHEKHSTSESNVRERGRRSSPEPSVIGCQLVQTCDDNSSNITLPEREDNGNSAKSEKET